MCHRRAPRADAPESLARGGDASASGTTAENSYEDFSVDASDADALRRRARVSGLGRDLSMRARAWAVALGVDIARVEGEAFAARAGRRGADARVVEADVRRAGQEYESEWNGDERALEDARVEIGDAIRGALNARETSSSATRYYQGLHDIAAAVVLCDRRRRGRRASDGLSAAILERLVLFHLRDHTRADLSETMEMTATWLDLMAKLEPRIAAALERAPTFYAVRWFMCWFLHDVNELIVSARLIDAFVASHPLLPIYVAAALVMKNKDKVSIAAASGDAMELLTTMTKLMIADVDAPVDAQLAQVQETLEEAFVLYEQLPPRATFRFARNSASTRYPYPWESDDPAIREAHGYAPLRDELVPYDTLRRWPLSAVDSQRERRRLRRLYSRRLLAKPKTNALTVAADVQKLFTALLFVMFVALRRSIARALGVLDFPLDARALGALGSLARALGASSPPSPLRSLLTRALASA